MQKPEKTLLNFAVIGTLLVFGMASISYIFFREPAAPSTDAPVAVDSVDSGSQPEAGSETEYTPVPADVNLYEIDPSQSEVRFTLGEVLGGEPKTVIGVTNNVSGTISLPADAPQDAQVGEIVVNARGFATDNDFRNRAIHNQILNTSSYEFIRFQPTSISGLPNTITFGESVSFEITGNLTIKDETHVVTFSANVTPASETQLDGHAEVMIAYADYGIFIPSAPRVADVDKEVLLEIDFVALSE